MMVTNCRHCYFLQKMLPTQQLVLLQQAVHELSTLVILCGVLVVAVHRGRENLLQSRKFVETTSWKVARYRYLA